MQIQVLKPTTGSVRDAQMGLCAALAGVISGMGEADFAQKGLAHLNRALPLCWWSVYRLYVDMPPVFHGGASHEVEDGTVESWRSYRAGLYRYDETFTRARELARDGGPVLTYWHASELRAPHRAQIYTRHGLKERVSVVSPDMGQGLLAINLYRHEAQAAFSAADFDCIELLGAPLLSAVQQHLRLVDRGHAQAAGTSRDSLFDALTTREREVCERLLQGWTHEGIAADLQISSTTVKTYRDRAFARLSIHHRNELFALAMRAVDDTTSSDDHKPIGPS